MAVWNLFSKREKRRERQGQEDVYQYDTLPMPFRVQVIHIWADALGRWVKPDPFNPIRHYPPNQWWHDIFRAITREKGVFKLADLGDDPFSQCRYYLQQAETKDALDLIEISFRVVDVVVRQMHDYERERLNLIHPDDAIAELNLRFREHCIGYGYASGQIERIDSRYIHAQAVKPALQLLHGAGKGFSGPLQEFLSAHEHYRKGNHRTPSPTP
jgi:hypothetical protein